MDRSWLLVEDRWYGRMVTELGISNIMCGLAHPWYMKHKGYAFHL